MEEKQKKRELKITEKHIIIGLLTLVLIGWFYWFQYKPMVIRKDCIKRLRDRAKTEQITLDYTLNMVYRACLIDHGMKPEDVVQSNP